MKPLLETSDLTVVYGGVHANEGIDLHVGEGEIFGLIGPNGAGKTTFIDAITGFTSVTRGKVLFGGEDVTGASPSRRANAGLVRTFQSVELFDDLSVIDNLLVACEPRRWWTFAADAVVPRQSAKAREQAMWALATVGLDAFAERLPSDLSQGQRKLVSVARALASRPRLLLVDEPAAGLDTTESLELGVRLRRIADEGITILLIDHDMGLVMSTCDRLCVLDFGRIIASGRPDEVRSDPRVVAAYLGAEAGEVQARAGDAIEATRNHAIELSSHLHAGESPAAVGTSAVVPADAVVHVEGLSAGYDGVPVVHDLSFFVGPGEVVALLGPNGAGKTTTLLTLSGLLTPLAGTVSVLGVPVVGRRAHHVARSGVAHVPEDRSLFFDLSAEENLWLGVRGRRAARHPDVSGILEMFPALQPLLKRKAGLLSGGEQQMLAMARAMMSEPKVMLIDELSLGLAPVIVERLLPLVRQMADVSGCGVILVEQHVHMALGVADRGYVISDGRIVLSGDARTLANRRDLLESSYLGMENNPQLDAVPRVR